MIILEKSRLDLSPVARDFGQGVSVVMRPLTSTEYGACKAKAADLEAKYLEGAEALSLVGLPPIQTEPDDDDPYLLQGMSRLLIAVFAAERVVSEWSGIGDADGVAIEPSLEAFGMLFQDALFLHAFESFAFVNLYHEAREGE